MNYDKILTLDKQNFIKYFISKLLLKNNYYVTINFYKYNNSFYKYFSIHYVWN